MGISLPQTGQGCVGMWVSGSSFTADTSGFALWRRKQDSNLRWVAPHLFSRQTPSATRSFRHIVEIQDVRRVDLISVIFTVEHTGGVSEPGSGLLEPERNGSVYALM